MCVRLQDPFDHSSPILGFLFGATKKNGQIFTFYAMLIQNVHLLWRVFIDVISSCRFCSVAFANDSAVAL